MDKWLLGEDTSDYSFGFSITIISNLSTTILSRVFLRRVSLLWMMHKPFLELFIYMSFICHDRSLLVCCLSRLFRTNPMIGQISNSHAFFLLRFVLIHRNTKHNHLFHSHQASIKWKIKRLLFERILQIIVLFTRGTHLLTQQTQNGVLCLPCKAEYYDTIFIPWACWRMMLDRGSWIHEFQWFYRKERGSAQNVCLETTCK